MEIHLKRPDKQTPVKMTLKWGGVGPHKLVTLKVGNLEVADTPCFEDTPVRFTASARVVPKVDSAIRCVNLYPEDNTI